MEPVTHVLTGACLARAGLNRKAAYVTLAMAVAAEFPDIDTLWGLRGPVAGFQHHRGITHTLIGIPVEAALLVLATMGLHRLRLRQGRRSPSAGPITQAPVRWTVLYGCVLLALASHLLLDYTNSYGLRPFFPFQDRWYAASIVFIFDPLLFVLLLAGLLLPALFGLVAREVGTARQRFSGTGWPRAALLLIVALWGWRAYEHSVAIALAQGQTLQAPAAQPTTPLGAQDTSAPEDDSAEPPRPTLTALRSLASPDPLSPYRWYTASDFGPADRLGVADTRTGVLFPGQILTRSASTRALDAAKRSHLGRVYLDWSVMPWVTSTSPEAAGLVDLRGAQTVVLFQDLRFVGGPAILQRQGNTPLTGEVLLGTDGNVLADGMDGRFGR